MLPISVKNIGGILLWIKKRELKFRFFAMLGNLATECGFGLLSKAIRLREQSRKMEIKKAKRRVFRSAGSDVTLYTVGGRLEYIC